MGEEKVIVSLSIVEGAVIEWANEINDIARALVLAAPFPITGNYLVDIINR